MDRPRLRANYDVELVPPAHAVLLSEEGASVLEGETLVRLLPLLDGQRDADEIAGRLESEVFLPEVYYSLMCLEEGGHLVDATGDAQLPRHMQAFWDVLGAGSAIAQDRLAAATVCVVSAGVCGRERILGAVRAAGLRTVDDEDDASLLVVIVDDYLQPALSALNRKAIERGRSWVPVKPVGSTLWIGPFFPAGVPGCWECLASRLEASRPAKHFVGRRPDASEVQQGVTLRHGASEALAGSLLAGEIVKWIATDGASKSGSPLLTLTLGAFDLKHHPFAARPQCRACGDPALADPQRPLSPLTLESRPRFAAQSGGHASRSPEEALVAYARHVDPLTGVIQSVRPADSGSDAFHGFVAVHEFPAWTPDLQSLRSTLIGRSGAQGVTEADAKLSAMGEAFERCAGIWRGEEERVIRGSRASLGDRALDLKTCLLFSDKQRLHRKEWHTVPPGHNDLVPKLLPDDLVIDWTPLQSLNDHSQVLLPTAYCYYGHPDMAHSFCYADSNGCAAGNTLEEAILSALIEVVERDAIAMWWYNCAMRPGVDVASFDVPYVATTSQLLRAARRDLMVIDVTSDIGMPAFAASSARLDHESEDILLGFGAHPDPRSAMVRALREMNQLLPSVASRDNDGNTLYLSVNSEIVEWLRTARRAAQPHLTPDPRQATKRFGDIEGGPVSDVRDEIVRWTSRLAQRGIRSFVLDQTRPDVGVAACRVVAPGMRHFWRRLAPGRLYDVPVEQGWLASPRSEDELNPLSVFF